MFAVIQTGGKQYKVNENQIISVEKLDKNIGEKINLDVLMISDEKEIKTGNPILKDVVCEAEVLEHGKADKITVYKYKAKKNERKKQGHRQPFTKLKILAIK